MPTRSRPGPPCAAIITALRPGPSLVAAVDSLLPQVDRVIVVDDGSPADAADPVLDTVAKRGAEVIRHGDNRGIGAALNTGIRAAAAGGALAYFLTLDQDSVLPEGAIELYLEAERAATAAGIRVGMIGPGSAATVRRFSELIGAVRTSEARDYFRLGGEPIQSGLLIPRPVLEDIGLFAEDLFIDSVDSDFYLRALEHGYRCIVAPAVRLAHRLGSTAPVRVAGRTIGVTVAQDFRYYYQVRNLIHMTRRHALRRPAWITGAMVREARHLTIVTVLVPGRAARIREAARGLGDGLRGVVGKRPEPVPAERAESVRGFSPLTTEAARPATRVSVCLAAYNGEAYIGEQLASILTQLSHEDEIVVVDDCSTDGTVDVVSGIDDPRIRLVRAERNQGYVRTFEDAIGVARGEFLLLSDQDDVWLPNHVDGLVSALESHDVAASNLTTLGGPDAIRGPYGQADWHLRSSDSRHPLRNILGILAGDRPYYGCAMGLRRAALAKGAVPFPDFLHESHDLWLALYGNAMGSIAHLDSRTVARRYHAGNQTPNRPRGVLAALRSRLLLLRCLGVLAGRRIHAGGSGRSPEGDAA